MLACLGNPDPVDMNVYLQTGEVALSATTLAIAETCFQLASARTVTRVIRKLCGPENTSAQVTCAAAELDE